jgi:hypothetical protein
VGLFEELAVGLFNELTVGLFEELSVGLSRWNGANSCSFGFDLTRTFGDSFSGGGRAKPTSVLLGEDVAVDLFTLV